MAMGLVKGEGFAVDASVMEANASRYHGKAPDEIDWTERAASDARGARSILLRSTMTAEPNPDRKPPKVISPSDPCSAWTAKANKRVQFGYGLNYLIDIENAVIVDVEATPARTYDEVEATKTMLDRTEQRFDLKPKRLAADTAYGTGRFLGWLVGQAGSRRTSRSGTRATATMAPSRARTSAGTSGAASTSARTARCCTPAAPCTTARTLLYRASKLDCDVCPLKAQVLSQQTCAQDPPRSSRGCPRRGASA